MHCIQVRSAHAQQQDLLVSANLVIVTLRYKLATGTNNLSKSDDPTVLCMLLNVLVRHVSGCGFRQSVCDVSLHMKTKKKENAQQV